MKFQILPNWCKKLGVFLFLFTLFSGYEGFMEGYHGERFNSGKYTVFSETTMHLFDIISIIGMIIYMLSKEKIEDDYIDKLRLESYQITVLIGLGGSILLFILSKDIELTLDYFIVLFLWIYLITFAIKKRTD